MDLLPKELRQRHEMYLYLRELRRRKLNIELFENQQQVKAESVTYKRVVLEVGRRGGKTDLMCEIMSYDLLNTPDANLLYIAKSGESAKNIAWAKLMKILSGKETVKINEHDLTIVSRNGSRLKLAGGDREPDSFRGPAYHKVFIDEAAFIRDLKYLVQEVVEPALLDYDGNLFLASTPYGFGEFYDFCKNKSFKYYHWTAYDNPYIKNASLDRIKAQYGEDSDIWQQEYLANPVRHAGLIFQNFRPYFPYVVPEIPKATTQMSILGIDPGTTAPNGYVLAHHNSTTNELSIEKAINKKCNLDKLAIEIKQDLDRIPHLIIIVDGHATHVIQQLASQYGLPIKAWTKKDIVGSYQRLITRVDALHLRVKEDSCKDLVNEMLDIEWKPTRDPNEESGKVLGSDHCVDALRYINEYIHFKDIKTPIISADGLDEYERKLIERMKQKKEERQWE